MEKEGVVCLVFIPSGGKFLTAARIAKTGGKENCPYRRDRPQNGKYLCRSGTDRKRCLQILSEKTLNYNIKIDFTISLARIVLRCWKRKTAFVCIGAVMTMSKEEQRYETASAHSQVGTEPGNSGLLPSSGRSRRKTRICKDDERASLF